MTPSVPHLDLSSSKSPFQPLRPSLTLDAGEGGIDDRIGRGLDIMASCSREAARRCIGPSPHRVSPALQRRNLLSAQHRSKNSLLFACELLFRPSFGSRTGSSSLPSIVSGFDFFAEIRPELLTGRESLVLDGVVVLRTRFDRTCCVL